MFFARDDERRVIGGDCIPQNENTLTVAAQDVCFERDANGLQVGRDGFTDWQKWHEEGMESMALSVSKAKKYRLNSRLVWNLEG